MEISEIKQLFYSYRNGIIADCLRKAGDPHHVIFGLNLPQLVQIAQVVGLDAEVANQLWHNDSSRECRLLAPMVYPRDEFSQSKSIEWASSVRCVEEADILCHRLLRYLDYAQSLCFKLYDVGTDLSRYTAIRLALNLNVLSKLDDIEKTRAMAKTERKRNCQLTTTLALSLLEDLDD